MATTRTTRTRRGAALGLVAAGLLATGVGAGLGPPYLAKEGATATGVSGTVLLVAGVLTALTGSVLLLRSVRARWWLLLVPALAAAAYAVVLPLAISVAATHVPATPLGDRDPGDVGLDYVAARFRAADGTALSGWYVPSRNRAAVVLAHGAGSNRTAVLGQAAVLARHGYGVLMVDARGHGESGGEAMDFGWHGESDLAGAVGYLERRPDVDAARIGALGLSMGGEEAIGAAGADPRIAAVVAEGATNRVFADRAWLRAYGVRGQAQRAVDRLTYWLADLFSDAPEPASLRESVHAARPRPLLLITAGDLPDEARAAALIRSGSPTTVTVWTVPGAGHTGGLRTAPTAWAARVVSFLDRNLLTGGTS